MKPWAPRSSTTQRPQSQTTSLRYLLRVIDPAESWNAREPLRVQVENGQRVSGELAPGVRFCHPRDNRDNIDRCGA